MKIGKSYIDAPNYKLAKRLNIAAIIFSLMAFVLIGMMRRPEFKVNTEIDFSFLPPLYSLFNVIVALSLIAALIFVKKGNIDKHRLMIYVALFFSACFFALYIMYHFTSEPTAFCKEGIIRSIYFFVLISHIVLAAISLPLILFTFIRAYTGQYARHKKLARWVYPIWLYVAISGPLTYLLLMPCYS